MSGWGQVSWSGARSTSAGFGGRIGIAMSRALRDRALPVSDVDMSIDYEILGRSLTRFELERRAHYLVGVAPREFGG